MVVDIGEVKRHIKPKADSTLHNMRKADLIEYIRCLEHNYNVAVSFNENQAKYIEGLGVSLGWIPVSERLPNFYPNKRRAVLVTLKDDDGKFLVTTAKYSEEHKYWYDFTESRFYRFDVLAWMLKPDAYEPPTEV